MSKSTRNIPTMARDGARKHKHAIDIIRQREYDIERNDVTRPARHTPSTESQRQ